MTAPLALPPTQMPPNHEQHRSFTVPDVEISTRSDGRRTVTGLVVPFLKPTEINEIRKGQLITYQEQFDYGSMHRAEVAPNRVQFQLEHDDRLERLSGYGASFRDSKDLEGNVGEFVLYPSMADRAIELLETSHRGLSITFVTINPLFGSERPGELVTRRSVHTKAVAAVSDPAYADAGVLALRAAADAVADAQAEADRQRDEMVETLTFLRDSGGALTEAQLRWLSEHGVDLGVAS